MAIFKNRHYGNFTQIDNTVIRSNLSDKALGALVRLLAHSETWKFNIQSFARERNVGETTTRNVINELIKAGHVERVRTQTKSGQFEFTFNVYETPISNQDKPETTSPVKKDLQQTPHVDSPLAENPQVDNERAIPIYNNKKDAIKKEAVKTEKEKAEPARQPYGKYKNVFLAENEYNNLVERFGKEQIDISLESMSTHKHSKKWKCNDDFRKLEEWIKRDISWGKTPQLHKHEYTNVTQANINSETLKTSNEFYELLRANGYVS